MTPATLCLWATTIGSISMLLLGCASNARLADVNLASPDRSNTSPITPPAAVAVKPAASLPKNWSTIAYSPTTADFINPERGFHNDINLLKGRDFSFVRRQGVTVSRAYIRLDEYRNRPLPATFLAQLNQQFQLVRSAGIKVFPRFTYNFPTGSDIKNSPDASLDRTLTHINQLKPILQQNADVIAAMQGGFIGAWGEWHSSGSGLDRREPKAKILNALLNAVPPNRMLQLRYVNDIRDNYPQALTIADAFRGGRKARVGFKNDCFLSNASDSGSFDPDLPGLKSYLANMSAFVPIGGETCQVSPEQQRTDCQTVESELARYHWSYLNNEFYKPALDRWQQEGCYAAISRKLGYRLQLIRSSFSPQIGRDRLLSGNFAIENVGYASPFNPRGLEVILRHRQTGKVYRLPILKSLSRTHDPRFWLPQAREIAVDVRAKVPPTAPTGIYEMLLNLPDPMPKLANRPEYSIRLANDRIWEAKTGFNSLRRTIMLKK